MDTQPYDWADTVKPLGKAPRLCPTLVIDRTPRQLADMLDGLHVAGGILIDPKRAQAAHQTAYQKAHDAIVAAEIAVTALVQDHDGAEAVRDMLTDVLLAFEDTVSDRRDEEPVRFVDTVRELDAKERYYAGKYGSEA